MARLSISTVVTNLCLFTQVLVATAQHYPRNTALNATTPWASFSTISPSSTSVQSSFSDIRGPFILAQSSTWTQVIIPTTVGTVMVTVNEATNQTSSTTIYHTDYDRNGTATLLTRTDTDAAGTVTQVVTDGQSRTMAITYPTNYFEAADSLTWDAVLPTMVDNSTCCFNIATLSATPTHTPFVQIGSLDTQDSRGWLYTLVGVDFGDPNTLLNPTEVSSLWSGQTLNIDYEGCPYTHCLLEVSSAAPASAVQTQSGAILATSTTTISSLPPGGSTLSKSASSQPATSLAPSTATPAQTSTPPSTQVSGAPPQSSAAQNSQPQSQQASKTTPQPGSASSNPVSTAAPAPAITIGSSAISANSASQFIIGGQTLAPGSSITLGSGTSTTVVALQTSGSNTVLVVEGSSSTLVKAVATMPPITVGNSVITADSASNYIIAGQTLAPGGSAIVVGGTMISLASGGTQLIEGTTTLAESTGVGGVIWSIFGGSATGTTTGNAAGKTGSSNSSTGPTFQQSSGMARVPPFWAAVVVPLLCVLRL